MFVYKEFLRLKNNLPAVAHITLNVKCMHKCKTCGYWRIYEKVKDRGMKKEEIFKICDDLISFGIKRFLFVDTDPLLRKDLPEIIKYLKNKDAHVQIVTTGMNLNKIFAENLISSGVDVIKFSIDGHNGLNDFIRGIKGAYKKSVQGIKTLKELRRNKNKPKIYVMTVVSKLNINEIEKIKEKIYYDTGGVDNHYFGPVLEIKKDVFEKTKWKGKNVASLNLIPYEKSYSLNYHDIKKLLKINKDKGTYFLFGRIIKLLDAILYIKRRKCPSFHQVHIDVDGNLIPCSFLPGIKLGNLKENSIKELWRKREHSKFINYLRKKAFPVCFEICWKRSIFNVASQTASLRELIFKRFGKF